MGDHAMQHLQKVGIFPDTEWRKQRPVRIPPDILMELASVMRLRSWCEGGLCDHLKENAAPAFAAFDYSVAKLSADPRAFAQEEDLPPLTAQIFDIWERHLAWSGLEELNADVLLDHSPADDEVLLNELVDFLWHLRHTGKQQTEG
jgi:hypothetical protein